MDIDYALLKLSQSGITYPEMMGYLMPDNPAYLSLNLVFRPTPGLDWLPKNGYLVGQYQPVMPTTACLGYALIKTQETSASSSHRAQLFTGRAVGDDHVDILQPFAELIGKAVDSFGNELLEPAAIHQLFLSVPTR